MKLFSTQKKLTCVAGSRSTLCNKDYRPCFGLRSNVWLGYGTISSVGSLVVDFVDVSVLLVSTTCISLVSLHG